MLTPQDALYPRYQALYDAMVLDAKHAPEPGSLPLYSQEGHSIGLVKPQAAAFLEEKGMLRAVKIADMKPSQAPSTVVQAVGAQETIGDVLGLSSLDTFTLIPPRQEPLQDAWQCTGSSDEYWAQMALSLKNAGLLRYWRGELLDIWSDAGVHQGRVERGVCRAIGMLTHAVHLHATTPEGRVWLAKRADTKPTCPGMWDTLVGGLVASGEPWGPALVRESFEEAGLIPDYLQNMSPFYAIMTVCRRLQEGYQRELTLYRHIVLPEGTPMGNQDGEVSEIRAFTLQELADLVEQRQLTTIAAITVIHQILGLAHTR